MDAERRQVTVLFTDMVGFHDLFRAGWGRSRLHPDAQPLEAHGRRRARAGRRRAEFYRRRHHRGLRRAGRVRGRAAPGLSRGALILQKLKTEELISRPTCEQPQLRIGLDTGAAVGKVQSGAEAGVTVLGDTVNFAARLQALAAPDLSCISDATHRSVQGMVDASFAGDHQVRVDSARKRSIGSMLFVLERRGSKRR